MSQLQTLGITLKIRIICLKIFSCAVWIPVGVQLNGIISMRILKCLINCVKIAFN